MNFDYLVFELTKFGYAFEISEEIDYGIKPLTTYKFAYSNNTELIIGFCTENKTTLPYMCNKISAENKHSFIDWSLCSMNLDFPTNFDQLKQLTDMLSILKNKEKTTEDNILEIFINNSYIYK